MLVKECEASRVAGLVNSLRVLSLTLCAESGACAEEKEVEEEKVEEVEKEEKACLEESNSALRAALEKAERATHELEDRVTGLEAAARRSQGAWEAKEKEAKQLALEVESVRRLNDELKMENEGLKRSVSEVGVGVEKEGVNGMSEEMEKEKEGIEEENAMTEEEQMEEEKMEEEEKVTEVEKDEKMEQVEKAEEEPAKEANEEKESIVEEENRVNEEKENKEEEQKEKEEAANEKEEPVLERENTVNEEKEEKEEQKEKENKETASEQPTTPKTEDNHHQAVVTEKLSQKRAAEENLNPPSKKPCTLTLSTLKLRIRYAFEKWNPKWMRRMKAVSDKLDKMAKTPEEGFKEMCTMYCVGRGRDG